MLRGRGRGPAGGGSRAHRLSAAPPGKPEKLRDDHFPELDVPCLFISGTKDPFGSPDELEARTQTIPGPVTYTWIDGKRHDLRGADDQIAETVVSWLDQVT